MKRKTVTTIWNPSFDDKPTSDTPRIKFSEKFSVKYLEKRNLILEIGCGTGSFTRLIDRKGCLGLDLDMNALRIANKYCANSEFVVASALYLPFRDKIFEVAFMWEVIEYIEKNAEKNAIQEIHRALIPGANFLLSAPNSHLIYNLTDPDYILFRRQRHFKIESLIGILTGTGFSIKQQTIRGGWKSIIAMNIFYFHKHFLHKKGGRLQSFFDKKSEEELSSNNNGITNIFIVAQKN